MADKGHQTMDMIIVKNGKSRCNTRAGDGVAVSIFCSPLFMMLGMLCIEIS